MVHKNIKRKGTNFERYLREKFFKGGIICFRVAGSGSTRKVPALDLICVYKGKSIGLEVKVLNSSNRLYIREEQYKELIEISKHMEVYIVVRIGKGRIYVISLSNYYYGISKDEIKEIGIPLEAFIEKMKTKEQLTKLLA